MASPAEMFTAWVITQMDGWPGDKKAKTKVIELLYVAYRQGKIDGMSSIINPMRQSVRAFDDMIATQGLWVAKLVKRVKEVIPDAKSILEP